MASRRVGDSHGFLVLYRLNIVSSGSIKHVSWLIYDKKTVEAVWVSEAENTSPQSIADIDCENLFLFFIQKFLREIVAGTISFFNILFT